MTTTTLCHLQAEHPSSMGGQVTPRHSCSQRVPRGNWMKCWEPWQRPSRRRTLTSQCLGQACCQRSSVRIRMKRKRLQYIWFETDTKRLHFMSCMYVTLPSEASDIDAFFVILRYLSHSREHTLLFKMMQKLSKSVQWSCCCYNSLNLQPQQHVILRNLQFSSYSH